MIESLRCGWLGAVRHFVCERCGHPHPCWHFACVACEHWAMTLPELARDHDTVCPSEREARPHAMLPSDPVQCCSCGRVHVKPGPARPRTALVGSVLGQCPRCGHETQHIVQQAPRAQCGECGDIHGIELVAKRQLGLFEGVA